MNKTNAALPPARTVRIALVEDLADVRDSWTRLIDGIPNFKCVCAFASGEEALRRLPDEKVDVTEGGGQLVALEEGTTLQAVVKALNALGATPRDIIAIMQALKAAGALRAEIVVI